MQTRKDREQANVGWGWGGVKGQASMRTLYWSSNINYIAVSINNTLHFILRSVLYIILQWILIIIEFYIAVSSIHYITVDINNLRLILQSVIITMQSVP